MNIISGKKINRAELIKKLSFSFQVIKDSHRLSQLWFYDTFDFRLLNNSLALWKDNNTVFLGLPDFFTFFKKSSFQPGSSNGPDYFYYNFSDKNFLKYLQEIISARALILLFKMQRNQETYRIENRQGKTIGKLICESSRIKNDNIPEKKLPPIIRIQKVRGYEEEYKKISENILSDKDLGRFDDLLSYSARVLKIDTSYSTKVKADLKKNMSIEKSFKILLRSFLNIMKKNKENIIRDRDSEFLHDFRVSVRRLRTLFSMSSEIFNPEKVNKGYMDFTQIGKITNDLRDIDVLFIEKPKFETFLDLNQRKGLDEFFTDLGGKRIQAFNRVKNYLNSTEYNEAMSYWENFSNSPSKFKGMSIGDYSFSVIAIQYNKVEKYAKGLKKNEKDRNIHRLRIKCKKLRYLLEFFSSLYDDDKMKKVLENLKDLQDYLGSFNDLSILQMKILGFISENESTKKNSKCVQSLLILSDKLDNEKEKKRLLFHKELTKYLKKSRQNVFNNLTI